MAELVFDTARQPQLAGVRGVKTNTRHLAWRAGKWSVDLRLETPACAGRLNMTGQVLNHQDPAQAVSQAWISLRTAQQTLAATATNQFGEFSLNYGGGSGEPAAPAGAPIEDVRLFVDVAGNDEPVLIPLGLLNAEFQAGDSANDSSLQTGAGA